MKPKQTAEQKLWRKMRAGWVKQSREKFTDQQIRLMAIVRDQAFPDQASREIFARFCRETGAGDHPDFLEVILRLAIRAGY